MTDPTTGRAPGDHGTAQDAIDFLLDAGTDYGPGEESLFLESWRTGDLGEWPEFYDWLAKAETQREPEPQPRTFGRGIVAGASAMFLAFYLLTGLVMGLGMERNIPAMNAAGVAYYAMTWPAFVSAGCFDTPAPPVPEWAFTFTDTGAQR